MKYKTIGSLYLQIFFQQFFALLDPVPAAGFDAIPAAITAVLTELDHAGRLFFCGLIAVRHSHRIGKHFLEIVEVVETAAGAAPIRVRTK